MRMNEDLNEDEWNEMIGWLNEEKVEWEEELNRKEYFGRKWYV